MNIFALYVLKISGNVFENQAKMPYTPPPIAEPFATSLGDYNPNFSSHLFRSLYPAGMCFNSKIDHLIKTENDTGVDILI